MEVKSSNSCPTDDSQISAFIKNLDQDSKALLLLGSLPLPFDSMTFTVISTVYQFYNSTYKCELISDTRLIIATVITLNGYPPKISLNCLLLIRNHHKMKLSKSVILIFIYLFPVDLLRE